MSRRQVAWCGVLWTARIATAAGLAIDAYVHLHLASLYAEGGGTINEGVLFRAEAAVALLAAVAIIATGRRVCYLAGLAVAASALTVMLVSRYIDLGQIGPFPDLYDPAWYPEKLLAAYAEGAATVTALAGVIMTGSAGEPPSGPAPRQRLTGKRKQINRRNITMASAFDRLPHRPLVAGLAGLAAAGLLAACSSGNGAAAGTGGGQQNSASGITVSARTVSGVGTVLTDQSGKTLYFPQQEAGGVIKCTSSCLSFWFPVTVGKGATPHATSTVTGTLGTIQRPDGGGRQLTYDGKPLYTFKLDSAPGQVHGNNFSDQFGSQSFTWHAITAGGGAPTSGQPSSPPSYSYQGGGY